MPDSRELTPAQRSGLALGPATSHAVALNRVAAVAHELLDDIANGLSIPTTLRAHGLHWRMWTDWLAVAEANREALASARKLAAEHYVAKSLEAAEGPGDDVDTAVRVARDRVKVDQFRWIASRCNPDDYGDKRQVEQSGAVKIVVEAVHLGPPRQEDGGGKVRVEQQQGGVPDTLSSSPESLDAPSTPSRDSGGVP